jgi:hypothetical protein
MSAKKQKEIILDGKIVGDHLEFANKQLSKKDLDNVEENSEEKKPNVCLEMFENMQKHFLEKLPDEEKEAYKKFGEKFHKNFDIMQGKPIDLSQIDMEEALSYVVESLKSGLHPKYLDENERALIQAGYGDEWYKTWGYDSIE